MTAHLTHPARASGAAAGTSRLLVAAMTTLLVVDLVGGLWSALSGVTRWGDAWGSHALLAAPLPMIAGQVALTWLLVRGGTRRAAVPAALLAAACLVSVTSGFFDGGLGNVALEPGMPAYQVLLLIVTGTVGVLAAFRARQLTCRQPNPSKKELSS